MPDKYIRASEIGEYIYCNRAWWLRHVKGHTPTNLKALQGGRAAHGRHARRVRRSARTARLALALAALAALLLVLAALAWWLGPA